MFIKHRVGGNKQLILNLQAFCRKELIVIQKVTRGPSAALLPVPAVLVTSRLEGSEPNIITIAWTGVMSSEPPVVYISVRPVGRHSYRLIKDSGEYVINIPSADQIKMVDYCGVVTGKDVNKFKETGLTPVPGARVRAPLIAECPVNIECRVRQILSLGSHDVFISDVLAVHYNSQVLDEKGRPDMEKIRPYGYCTGEYRELADRIGRYGFSKRE
ncbi:MAG: flavin reductase family protein [Pelotomaculaceae bacterium]|uniref:Flavoredoxin n=1 Tax=anaerobic digester metagenome TaxID=1263854 RepID=A0A485LYT3_9ZZZZ|nr:flavin reductase family protein [Bacillota bacterium]